MKTTLFSAFQVGEKYEEMEECYGKKIEEIRESSADTEVLAERLTHVAKL